MNRPGEHQCPQPPHLLVHQNRFQILNHHSQLINQLNTMTDHQERMNHPMNHQNRMNPNVVRYRRLLCQSQEVYYVRPRHSSLSNHPSGCRTVAQRRMQLMNHEAELNDFMGNRQYLGQENCNGGQMFDENSRNFCNLNMNSNELSQNQQFSLPIGEFEQMTRSYANNNMQGMCRNDLFRHVMNDRMETDATEFMLNQGQRYRSHLADIRNNNFQNHAREHVNGRSHEHDHTYSHDDNIENLPNGSYGSPVFFTNCQTENRRPMPDRPKLVQKSALLQSALKEIRNERAVSKKNKCTNGNIGRAANNKNVDCQKKQNKMIGNEGNETSQNKIVPKQDSVSTNQKILQSSVESAFICVNQNPQNTTKQTFDSPMVSHFSLEPSGGATTERMQDMGKKELILGNLKCNPGNLPNNNSASSTQQQQTVRLVHSGKDVIALEKSDKRVQVEGKAEQANTKQELENNNSVSESISAEKDHKGEKQSVLELCSLKMDRLLHDRKSVNLDVSFEQKQHINPEGPPKSKISENKEKVGTLKPKGPAQFKPFKINDQNNAKKTERLSKEALSENIVKKSSDISINIERPFQPSIAEDIKIMKENIKFMRENTKSYHEIPPNKECSSKEKKDERHDNDRSSTTKLTSESSNNKVVLSDYTQSERNKTMRGCGNSDQHIVNPSKVLDTVSNIVKQFCVNKNDAAALKKMINVKSSKENVGTCSEKGSVRISDQISVKSNREKHAKNVKIQKSKAAMISKTTDIDKNRKSTSLDKPMSGGDVKSKAKPDVPSTCSKAGFKDRNIFQCVFNEQVTNCLPSNICTDGTADSKNQPQPKGDNISNEKINKEKTCDLARHCDRDTAQSNILPLVSNIDSDEETLSYSSDDECMENGFQSFDIALSDVELMAKFSDDDLSNRSPVKTTPKPPTESKCSTPISNKPSSADKNTSFGFLQLGYCPIALPLGCHVYNEDTDTDTDENNNSIDESWLKEPPKNKHMLKLCNKKYDKDKTEFRAPWVIRRLDEIVMPTIRAEFMAKLHRQKGHNDEKIDTLTDSDKAVFNDSPVLIPLEPVNEKAGSSETGDVGIIHNNTSDMEIPQKTGGTKPDVSSGKIMGAKKEPIIIPLERVDVIEIEKDSTNMLTDDEATDLQQNKDATTEGKNSSENLSVIDIAGIWIKPSRFVQDFASMYMNKAGILQKNSLETKTATGHNVLEEVCQADIEMGTEGYASDGNHSSDDTLIYSEIDGVIQTTKRIKVVKDMESQVSKQSENMTFLANTDSVLNEESETPELSNVSNKPKPKKRGRKPKKKLGKYKKRGRKPKVKNDSNRPNVNISKEKLLANENKNTVDLSCGNLVLAQDKNNAMEVLESNISEHDQSGTEWPDNEKSSIDCEKEDQFVATVTNVCDLAEVDIICDVKRKVDKTDSEQDGNDVFPNDSNNNLPISKTNHLKSPDASMGNFTTVTDPLEVVQSKCTIESSSASSKSVDTQLTKTQDMTDTSNSKVLQTLPLVQTTSVQSDENEDVPPLYPERSSIETDHLYPSSIIKENVEIISNVDSQKTQTSSYKTKYSRECLLMQEAMEFLYKDKDSGESTGHQSSEITTRQTIKRRHTSSLGKDVTTNKKNVYKRSKTRGRPSKKQRLDSEVRYNTDTGEVQVVYESSIHTSSIYCDVPISTSIDTLPSCYRSSITPMESDAISGLLNLGSNIDLALKLPIQNNDAEVQPPFTDGSNDKPYDKLTKGSSPTSQSSVLTLECEEKEESIVSDHKNKIDGRSASHVEGGIRTFEDVKKNNQSSNLTEKVQENLSSSEKSMMNVAMTSDKEITSPAIASNQSNNPRSNTQQTPQSNNQSEQQTQTPEDGFDSDASPTVEKLPVQEKSAGKWLIPILERLNVDITRGRVIVTKSAQKVNVLRKECYKTSFSCSSSPVSKKVLVPLQTLLMSKENVASVKEGCGQDLGLSDKRQTDSNENALLPPSSEKGQRKRNLSKFKNIKDYEENISPRITRLRSSKSQKKSRGASSESKVLESENSCMNKEKNDVYGDGNIGLKQTLSEFSIDKSNDINTSVSVVSPEPGTNGTRRSKRKLKFQKRKYGPKVPKVDKKDDGKVEVSSDETIPLQDDDNQDTERRKIADNIGSVQDQIDNSSPIQVPLEQVDDDLSCKQVRTKAKEKKKQQSKISKTQQSKPCKSDNENDSSKDKENMVQKTKRKKQPSKILNQKMSKKRALRSLKTLTTPKSKSLKKLSVGKTREKILPNGNKVQFRTITEPKEQKILKLKREAVKKLLSNKSCGYCSILVPAKQYGYHVKVTHPYRCAKCALVFETKELKYAHRKEKHLNNPYSCIVCNQNFDLKYHYDSHVKSIKHKTFREIYRRSIGIMKSCLGLGLGVGATHDLALLDSTEPTNQVSLSKQTPHLFCTNEDVTFSKHEPLVQELLNDLSDIKSHMLTFANGPSSFSFGGQMTQSYIEDMTYYSCENAQLESLGDSNFSGNSTDFSSIMSENIMPLDDSPSSSATIPLELEGESRPVIMDGNLLARNCENVSYKSSTGLKDNVNITNNIEYCQTSIRGINSGKNIEKSGTCPGKNMASRNDLEKSQSSVRTICSSGKDIHMTQTGPVSTSLSSGNELEKSPTALFLDAYDLLADDGYFDPECFRNIGMPRNVGMNALSVSSQGMLPASSFSYGNSIHSQNNMNSNTYPTSTCTIIRPANHEDYTLTDLSAPGCYQNTYQQENQYENEDPMPYESQYNIISRSIACAEGMDFEDINLNV